MDKMIQPTTGGTRVETKETVESNPKMTAIRLLILEVFASWFGEFVSAATDRFC